MTKPERGRLQKVTSNSALSLAPPQNEQTYGGMVPRVLWKPKREAYVIVLTCNIVSPIPACRGAVSHPPSFLSGNAWMEPSSASAAALLECSFLHQAVLGSRGHACCEVEWGRENGTFQAHRAAHPPPMA